MYKYCFKYIVIKYWNIIQAKQITNLLLLSNLNDFEKKKDELYGLVTRYGPRASHQRKLVN